jgi:hypothetical protein
MRKSLDITNQQFNNLIGVNYSHTNKVQYWDFKCLLCGNITKHRKPDVTRGRIKSCGCQKNSGKNNGNWYGYEDINGRTVGHYQKNAEKRNIEFNVTIKYLWEVYIEQKKMCPYTGVDLVLNPKSKYSRTPSNASLDRIDSNLGYIVGNVQWVYKKINVFKSDMSHSDFIDMCYLVTNHCVTNPIHKKGNTTIFIDNG